MLNEPTHAVLGQIIGLTEVGLERELFARSADLERAAWHTQAIHDSLTGLYNRVSLTESFSQLMAFDDQNGLPRIAAMMMIDIDHFRDVNDVYGKPVGDRILQHVASSILASVRPSDLAFHFGGEEFLVLLNNVDFTRAMTAAERIRASVAGGDDELPKVTSSMDVALRHAGESQETLITRADLALYESKREGRNRISVAK